MPTGWAFAVALLVGMSGALILGIGLVVELPAAWFLAGVVALALGVVIVFVLAFRESHRSGVGIVRSLGRGIRSAGGWLVALIP